MFSATRIFGALFILTFAGLLAGCGTRVDETSTTNVRGIDPKNFDTTVSPCTDFYQYANGGWVAHNPVPAEYGSWGTMHEVYERGNETLQTILDEVAAGRHQPGSVEQKLGDFVASGMDTAAINATGVTPLQADFAKINSIGDVPQLCRVISEYHAEGVGMLFDTDALEDLMNSSMVNLYATQGGLGLPEQGYYVRQDEESDTLRKQYVEHIANMFKLLGDDEATATANAAKVLALETRLAESSYNNVEIRNYPEWYRVKTVAQLYETAPNFDWNTYLTVLGHPEVKQVSFGPERFFEGVSKALVEVPLDDWKQYLRWNLISANAFYVGEKFDAENFRFYGNILGGSQERRERWKRVLSQTDAVMGEALGQIFVQRTFPPESKERAVAMVANLKTAVHERLENLAWMTPETKAKAIAKLDALGEKIGYPDKWRDYTDLQVGKKSFIENIRAGRQFAVDYSLSKVGKAPDPDEWSMNPQTVNAGYSPLKNEIVFPAGILQPPYFDGEIDDAVNYGAMGAVIGHEMLHAFDDAGSRFDADGNMVNWWTDEDRAKFEEKTGQLVKQFNDYIAIDSLHVNGELTLGENIADLGGLRVAFRALQIAREGKKDPMVDGFTQEQRFFLSFAQCWRSNSTDEAMKLRVQSDEHSPRHLRVLGPLSNMDEFEQAFGCSEDSPMMRPVADRIHIW